MGIDSMWGKTFSPTLHPRPYNEHETLPNSFPGRHLRRRPRQDAGQCLTQAGRGICRGHGRGRDVSAAGYAAWKGEMPEVTSRKVVMRMRRVLIKLGLMTHHYLGANIDETDKKSTRHAPRADLSRSLCVRFASGACGVLFVGLVSYPLHPQRTG